MSAHTADDLTNERSLWKLDGTGHAHHQPKSRVKKLEGQLRLSLNSSFEKTGAEHVIVRVANPKNT